MTRTTKPGSGRVVIVTGAAGGIGSVFTAALLAAGHAVAAIDRDAARLEQLVAAHPDACLHPILADLATVEACDGAVGESLARFGRVDAVINNAGIGVSSIRPDAEQRHPSIEELSPELWDEFFAINVRAPLAMVRAALPSMKAGAWGRIINNTTSYRTMLRLLPYGATKSALESMSAIWANELLDSGITVNVLIPGGPTDTPFIADGSGMARDEMLQPAIMGPPLAWLMSDAAAAVTGQRITAARWDPAVPPAEAAAASSRAIGWPELTADAVWPGSA